MESNLRFEVGPADAGSRLDVFLREKVKRLSRPAVVELLNRGGVRLNGVTVKKPSKRLEALCVVEIDGLTLDELRAQIDERRGLCEFSVSGDEKVIVPEDLPLDIVYENEEVLIVSKPEGQVVHPAAGVSGGTLVNAVAWHFKKSGLALPHRVGLVHRLDKEVSGLMIFGKTAHSQKALAAQFDSSGIYASSPETALKNKAHKYYQAVVENYSEGVFDGLESVLGGKFFKLDGYIKRRSNDRRRFEFARRHGLLSDSGKMDLSVRYCRSYVRCIGKDKEGQSVVEVLLATGRSHQIRSQLSAMGIPVVGDLSYGAKKPYGTGIKLRSAALCYIPAGVCSEKCHGNGSVGDGTDCPGGNDVPGAVLKCESVCVCLESDRRVSGDPVTGILPNGRNLARISGWL